MEEGTGLSQEDFDSLAPGEDAADPSSWPTEPLTTSTVEVDTAPPSHLPTTTGIETVGVIVLGLLASLVIVAGLVMLQRKYSGNEW